MDYKKLAEIFWLFLEKNPSRKEKILAALRKVLTYFIDGSIELNTDDAANAIFGEVFIEHRDELKTFIIDQSSQENIFDSLFKETSEKYKYQEERLKNFIDRVLKIAATKLFKQADDPEKNQEIIEFLEQQQICWVEGVSTSHFNYLGIHGESALHWAGYYGNHGLASSLIERGAVVDFQDTENQRTPIMWAMLRVLHDPEKYINFIKLMVEKHDADASIRDHNDRNISDLISFFSSSLSQLSFLQNYVPEGEVHLFKAPNSDGNPQDEFYQHGDDSSDEETTNTNTYAISNKLEAFKASGSYEELDEDDDFRKKICLSFVLHARGLQFLYSDNVNKNYYGAQKKSLGANKKPNEDKLTAWIREALYLTIQTINFSGVDISGTQKKEIDAFLDGDDEELDSHSGVVTDFVANIHKVLRATDLRLAQESLSKYLSVFSDDAIWNKSIKAVRDKHDLKGKKETTIVMGYPAPIMAELSPNTGKNRKLYKRYVARLIQVVGIDSEISKKLFADPSSSSSSTSAVGLDIDEKTFNAFKLTFFYYLRDLRAKHQIVFTRGLDEVVIYDVPQNHADSVSWFSSMRVANRFYKRKLKHRENKHFVGHPNAKESSRVHFGYYLTDHSFWKLPLGTMVLSKEQITTNQVRTNLVEFTFGKDSTYKGISAHIAKFIAKPANTLTDKKIAESIRAILQGKPPTLKTDELNNFVSQLTYLLFFCETSRNPATFIVNQMMLDLIIDKNMTWTDFLGEKTLMPMAIENAVGCAGYLNQLFASNMPFPYKYGDNDNKNSVTPNLQNLLSKTDKLVRIWVANFVDSIPKIKLITKSKGKAKTEAEIKAEADSKEARKEAIDAIVYDPDKLLAEIDKRVEQWYRLPKPDPNDPNNLNAPLAGAGSNDDDGDDVAAPAVKASAKK